MRISDWSSDVCSSDLDKRCQQHLRPLHRSAGPLQDLGPQQRRAPAVEPVRRGVLVDQPLQLAGSEERRVGTECVSTVRSRWSQYHSKNTNHTIDISTRSTTQCKTITEQQQQGS